MMKFSSFDSIGKKDQETEIRIADSNTSHLFTQTWVPDYIMRILRDPQFPYVFFPWDFILKVSNLVGSASKCYGAFTGERLDGLLCLSIEDQFLKIEFIATAPWNYFTVGKMRRIGSGLIYFTIKVSQNFKLGGEFKLNALPQAEQFYKSIGMVETGKTNKEGLKELAMRKTEAVLFAQNFKKFVIKE
jgi:hypothetical protein